MFDFSGNLVIGIVITASSVVLSLVYLLHQLRIRRRDARMKVETSQSPEDRAFNEIRIARAGADHLQRQGHDVSPVRRLLADAEQEERRHHAADALRLAQAARERLVGLRAGPGTNHLPAEPRLGAPSGPGPLSPRGTASVASAASLAIDDGDARATEDPADPRRRLVPHQAEARFAVEQLGREIPRANGGSAAARREAEGLLREATVAYGRADYREAWRLALKGRRRLGGPVEAVGLGPVRGRPSSSPSDPPSPASEKPAPGACSECGRENGPKDQFCRGCGATLGGMRCPRCGAPAHADDRFCGVCGTPADR